MKPYIFLMIVASLHHLIILPSSCDDFAKSKFPAGSGIHAARWLKKRPVDVGEVESFSYDPSKYTNVHTGKTFSLTPEQELLRKIHRLLVSRYTIPDASGTDMGLIERATLVLEEPFLDALERLLAADTTGKARCADVDSVNTFFTTIANAVHMPKIVYDGRTYYDAIKEADRERCDYYVLFLLFPPGREKLRADGRILEAGRRSAISRFMGACNGDYSTSEAKQKSGHASMKNVVKALYARQIGIMR